MLKQAALHFVCEPIIGTETAKDASDFALGGALARALDGALDSIEDAAQKAAPRRGGLAAATMRQLAGHAEIPIERNAVHGWDPFSIIEIFSCVWLPVVSVVVIVVGHKGYVLIL
jgi:hypothetical protein